MRQRRPGPGGTTPSRSRAGLAIAFACALFGACSSDASAPPTELPAVDTDAGLVALGAWCSELADDPTAEFDRSGPLSLDRDDISDDTHDAVKAIEALVDTMADTDHADVDSLVEAFDMAQATRSAIAPLDLAECSAWFDQLDARRSTLGLGGSATDTGVAPPISSPAVDLAHSLERGLGFDPDTAECVAEIMEAVHSEGAIQAMVSGDEPLAEAFLLSAASGCRNAPE